MKAYGELKYSSTFLHLGTRWRRMVSFSPLPLYSRGKSPRHPLDRRLGGPGRCGEKIEHCRESNPDRPARRYTEWAISTPASNWVQYWTEGPLLGFNISPPKRLSGNSLQCFSICFPITLVFHIIIWAYPIYGISHLIMQFNSSFLHANSTATGDNYRASKMKQTKSKGTI
jgi:hypothetical protein